MNQHRYPKEKKTQFICPKEGQGLKDFIFRIESTMSENGKAKQHQKKKKWRQLDRWRQILGTWRFKGTKDDDLYFLLSKAMTKIGLLQYNDFTKEQQILELLKANSSENFQKTLQVERQNLALSSARETRENLIEELRDQNEYLKQVIKRQKEEIEAYKAQLWPPGFDNYP